MSQAVVIGGTSGLGLELARRFVARGDSVVITGRDEARAAGVASDLGAGAVGLALDLARPQELAERLAPVEGVARLVLCAIERDENSVREYDVDRALRLVTLKLVGYTEVVHALASRLTPEASILLFGGLAKERPYPGSTTVTTVNGGVTGMVKTLTLELKPVRVNAIHPGIVGDSPAWKDKPAGVLDAVRDRTPTGRLVAMQDVVEAALTLLDNPSINGTELNVDGGWLLG